MQVRGVEFPSTPGFNINEATDILLKKDFDKYRGTNKTHPFLKQNGLEYLVPYDHQHFDLWTPIYALWCKRQNEYYPQRYKFKIGGGLDDVLVK